MSILCYISYFGTCHKKERKRETKPKFSISDSPSASLLFPHPMEISNRIHRQISRVFFHLDFTLQSLWQKYIFCFHFRMKETRSGELERGYSSYPYKWSRISSTFGAFPTLMGAYTSCSKYKKGCFFNSSLE